jgi:hypothetical protein
MNLISNVGISISMAHSSATFKSFTSWLWAVKWCVSCLVNFSLYIDNSPISLTNGTYTNFKQHERTKLPFRDFPSSLHLCLQFEPYIFFLSILRLMTSTQRLIKNSIFSFSWLGEMCGEGAKKHKNYHSLFTVAGVMCIFFNSVRAFLIYLYVFHIFSHFFSNGWNEQKYALIYKWIIFFF